MSCFPVKTQGIVPNFTLRGLVTLGQGDDGWPIKNILRDCSASTPCHDLSLDFWSLDSIVILKM